MWGRLHPTIILLKQLEDLVPALISMLFFKAIICSRIVKSMRDMFVIAHPRLITWLDDSDLMINAKTINDSDKRFTYNLRLSRVISPVWIAFCASWALLNPIKAY